MSSFSCLLIENHSKPLLEPSSTQLRIKPLESILPCLSAYSVTLTSADSSSSRNFPRHQYTNSCPPALQSRWGRPSYYCYRKLVPYPACVNFCKIGCPTGCPSSARLLAVTFPSLGMYLGRRANSSIMPRITCFKK